MKRECPIKQQTPSENCPIRNSPEPRTRVSNRLSVSSAYKIQNRVLIREKGELTLYAPMIHLELPSEISKLQRGDETELLNFVHTYGEFGYVCL